MLRGTQIALIAAVCLWGLLSAFGNLLDWQGTLGAVTAVATMRTWEGGGDDWRAIGSPVLITTAALAIVAFKLLSALLCGLGAARMVRERGAPIESFAVAKATALSG
jgi:predicted small integral membrane protein